MTVAPYVHLLDDDLGGPLRIAAAERMMSRAEAAQERYADFAYRGIDGAAARP